jgi:hypothetical protein
MNQEVRSLTGRKNHLPKKVVLGKRKFIFKRYLAIPIEKVEIMLKRSKN